MNEQTATPTRHAYKITFSNGDSTVTEMNASLSEAREYYLNNWFNSGDTDENPSDIMVKGILVEEVA